jgi:hypothetical protein
MMVVEMHTWSPDWKGVTIIISLQNCAGRYGPVIDPFDVHCWWFCLAFMVFEWWLPLQNCAGKYGPIIDPFDVHCWWFCLGRNVGNGDMGIRQCCLLPFNCFNVPTPLFPLGYCFPCSNNPPK